jgi:phenylpyruvate tautomerase PptA (4-oxalocrotonate tautomerase family)
MPNVDIKSLHMELEERATLADKITGVLKKYFGCAADAVTMRFEEVRGDQYAVGGKLLPVNTAVAIGPPNQILGITLGFYDKRGDS